MQAKAFQETNTILNAHPGVKLVMAICSPGVPGAAEAVKQAGRQDENKQYVHAGITESVILWNTMDLGYLTVRTAHDLATGKLKAGDTSIDAGRVGKVEIKEDNVLLGQSFVITKENIDQFDF